MGGGGSLASSTWIQWVGGTDKSRVNRIALGSCHHHGRLGRPGKPMNGGKAPWRVASTQTLPQRNEEDKICELEHSFGTACFREPLEQLPLPRIAILNRFAMHTVSQHLFFSLFSF